MDEIEKVLKEFLDYWFAGFSCGIETWGLRPVILGVLPALRFSGCSSGQHTCTTDSPKGHDGEAA